MNTITLLHLLSQQSSKASYLAVINNELNRLVSHLTNLGYNINSQVGLIGQQTLNTANDTYNYGAFRDVHFMHHGLQHGNWIFHPIDALYYTGLQGFVQSQYNTLP